MYFIKNIDAFLGVFLLGILSMGFQLVASRLLAPHFGSSIIVWAFLISTFLAAFSSGAIIGGLVSKLCSKKKNMITLILLSIGVTGFAFTAFFGKEFLRLIENASKYMSINLFYACLCLFFIPVMILSVIPPLLTEIVSKKGLNAGLASGLIYGISTIGNIAGVMGTAFWLIPHIRISYLLIMWFIFTATLFIFFGKYTRQEERIAVNRK